MIRLLPFILIPVLLIAGLGYWRYSASRQDLEDPQLADSKTGEDSVPLEVPKTLPGATVEQRVKSLEDTITKLTAQVNNIKSSGPQTQSSGTTGSNPGEVESAVTELKARVSALEKATPVPASTVGKSTVFIPLGAGGNWSDIDWNSLSEYEISLNPDNYPGYSGMNLEANFRMVESAGIGSVRLYNVTDSSAVSEQLDTTATAFTLKTSASFKLPAGTKTYRLQVKSTQRKDLFIQSARIKVNF